MKGVWRSFLDYVGSPDPRLNATNWVSVLVASNQPFYPVYVWFVVGFDHFASAITLLSTPFFVAVPWVSRRSPRLAKAMLPLVGALNTLLTAKAVGAESGVELFLFPCAMAAGMAFAASERIAMLAVLGTILAAYFGLHGRLGAPLHVFDADGYARFLNMNILSVAGLTGLIALQFSRANVDA